MFNINRPDFPGGFRLKVLTFSTFVVEYPRILQRQCGNEKESGHFSEGDTVRAPSDFVLSATSKPPGRTGTGCSRYRATKMPVFSGELGWYRELLRPYVWAEFIFLYIFMEVISNG